MTTSTGPTPNGARGRADAGNAGIGVVVGNQAI
jgi:hypothetical protein